MAFASTLLKRTVEGEYYVEIYTFTGASGDTGGTIQTGLTREVVEVKASGELADGSANIAALTAGITGTDGEVRLTYTNPVANHKGRVTIKGRYA